jgi:hypothetical protein
MLVIGFIYKTGPCGLMFKTMALNDAKPIYNRPKNQRKTNLGLERKTQI